MAGYPFHSWKFTWIPPPTLNRLMIVGQNHMILSLNTIFGVIQPTVINT